MATGTISPADLTTTFLEQAVGVYGRARSPACTTTGCGNLTLPVPDLSVVPDYKGLGPTLGAEAGALAKDFNTDVLSEIKALNMPGLTVFDVPVFSTIDKIVANPSQFGLTNVSTPCASG